jgi:flagellar assembly protein FliH
MSLSRYYKSSTSFQPEEIVKQEGSRPAGWTPLPRSDGKPFMDQRFTADKDLQENPSMEKAASPHPSPVKGREATVLEPEGHLAESQAAVDAPYVEQLPPQIPIDLSKYVELAVAEKQNDEAYRRGLEKGRVEGHDKAELDFGAATRALLLACQQLETLRETIIGNSSRELLDFALAIAERILRISVREQDASIVATIEEALHRAVKSDEFSIFIHPDDYAAVSEKAAEIVAGISGLNNVVLRKDKTVERGGAKIESDNCTIDATIAGQFDLIREEVQKRL